MRLQPFILLGSSCSRISFLTGAGVEELYTLVEKSFASDILAAPKAEIRSILVSGRVEE